MDISAADIVNDIVRHAELRQPTVNSKDATDRLFMIYKGAAELARREENVVEWLGPFLHHTSASVRCTIAALLLRYNDKRAVAELEKLAGTFGLPGFVDVTAKYTLSEWRAGRLLSFEKLIGDSKEP